MKKWILASNNAGKLAEFSRLFKPYAIECVPQNTFSIPEAEEPYETFLENALAKARHASRLSGLPALADDSGLCVPALGGAPGVFSARFAGEPKSDTRNNTALLEKLEGITTRSAYYYAVLVWIAHEKDPQPVIAEGFLKGEILLHPQGTGGFGYDPIFWIPATGCTAAELKTEEKNKMSHRGLALASLLDKLEKRGLFHS